MFITEDLHLKYSLNKAFITENNKSLTYAELNNFAQDIKPYMRDRSLIFSLCENTPGSLLGYFSFISNKSVPLLLDSKIDKSLLNNLLSTYKPNYLWIPDRMIEDFTGLKHIFSSWGYSLLEYSIESISLDDNLALLLTTSGSTGSPKLVRLSYNNIKANAESIRTYLEIKEDDRPATSLPMHYSFGLSVINSHLISGATILLTNQSILEKDFWGFVRENQATTLSGVPYTYEMLQRLRFFRMDLPHLKRLTQAGGRLSPQLVQEYTDNCRKSGKEFVVMYGQTEATARMSYLPFNLSEGKYNSIGIAIPGGKFKLLNENGVEINECDTDGELIYSGGNVSLGYAEVPADLHKGDENQGVLYTGDIARRDKDGFYYITGRKKRFIKLYGNRVNLDATDQLLKDYIKTGECACSGEDDKLVVYTTNGDKAEEIIRFLSEKTGINNRAFSVKQVTEIPKSSSGKILYAELNKL